MRIVKIEVENYRQYRDQVFDFASGQNVSVIVGRIGSGKTNLLNALTWCLYGKEHFAGGDMEVQQRGRSRADDGPRNGLPLLNVGPLDRDLKPGLYETKVEITLELEAGARAIVSRRQNFIVKDDNDVTPDGDSRLTVMYKRDGAGYDDLAEPQHWVNKHLPERVRPYFVLNTERLQQFFHQGAEASRVKNAILEIAQIDVLATMRDRLNAVRSDYYQSAGSGGGDELLVRLQGDRARLEERIAGKNEDLRRQAEALERHEHDIAEILDEIGDMEEAATLVREHEDKEDELERVVKDLEGAELELRKQSALDAPAVLGLPMLERFLQYVDTAIEAGRWPAPVHPGYVRKLISESRCMCGCELDDERRARLEQIARDGEQSPNRVLMEMQRPAAVLKSRAESYRQRIGPTQSRMADLNTRGTRLRQRLDAIQSDLDRLGVKDRDFDLKKERWSMAHKGKESALTAIALLGKEVEGLETQLAETTKNLKLQLAKDEGKRELARMVAFTEECITAVDRAYTELITETREEVSSALNDSFLKMIEETKGRTFTSAAIDANYRVSITAASRFDAAENLGGGEDVCLALSFSQALGRVSGFELPLILDSPFVKLDPEAMSVVMRTMLDNLSGRQMILLMKTQEYNSGVQDVLRDHGVSDALRLEFDEQTQSTSVIGA